MMFADNYFMRRVMESQQMKTINALIIFFAILISGCAALPNAMTDQIDNRRIEYALVRNGQQTVVFENGLGATMDWWAKVLPEVSKQASTFAYNRPGYGKSEISSTPRDGQHVVDELRSVLKAKELNPPYILVGHSLGGLYMQQFARRYPNEVSALVLVDSTHPEQLKGDGAFDKWPLWVRLVMNVTTSKTAKEELNAVDITGNEVMSLPSFVGKPVIVLSALQPMRYKSVLANDSNKKRQDIARLYPGAEQIWVDSGHAIPLENPQSVISAIRQLLSK